jgi:hypothetical protein
MTRVNYLYVDGESHYIRTEKAIQELWGSDKKLKNIGTLTHWSSCNIGAGKPRINLYEEGKFFWDSAAINLAMQIEPNLGHRMPEWFVISRAVYFTSIAGDDEKLFDLMKLMRNTDFEPCVAFEPKTLEQRRKNTLAQYNVIEKPKEADIALATRMLEDAYHNNYTHCYLFTSDIDYLPVIKAVRQMGKNVFVFGSADGIAKDSPFLFVPDKFYDIGTNMIKSQYASAYQNNVRV